MFVFVLLVCFSKLLLTGKALIHKLVQQTLHNCAELDSARIFEGIWSEKHIWEYIYEQIISATEKKVFIEWATDKLSYSRVTDLVNI